MAKKKSMNLLQNWLLDESGELQSRMIMLEPNIFDKCIKLKHVEFQATFRLDFRFSMSREDVSIGGYWAGSVLEGP